MMKEIGKKLFKREALPYVPAYHPQDTRTVGGPDPKGTGTSLMATSTLRNVISSSSSPICWGLLFSAQAAFLYLHFGILPWGFVLVFRPSTFSFPVTL